MPGLGPRVGGAHVDVNMKFDDKSVGDVGKRIHRQLSSLSDSLAQVGDRNREVYRSIGKDAVTAWRALLGSVVAGAPLMGSAISGVAGGATLLAGALNSSVKSSFGLLPIMTSLGVAGLTASIGMRNFGAAVSETNPKALKELLADMPKSMQAAVMSTRAMSKEMRAVIWEKLFVGIGPLMQRLRDTGVIQRGLGKMAEQLNVMARGVLEYATSAKGVKVLNEFFDNNAKVFGALSKAVVPFLDGFLRLVNALTPAAIRLAGRITDVAERFSAWTQGEGFAERIDKMMKRSEKTAGLLFKVLGNLGGAINNIFNAANPATNTFLQMLVGVTERFEKWTASAGGKNSIAEWAMNSVDVMRQFGHTAEAVFKVIAELADPRVIISFLKTLEGAFNYLGKLPLDKIVDGFVRIAETLQPVSSLFLAIIIGGAALNIMIGSLIGQVGGLFSVLSKIIQFKILTSILKNMGGGAKGAGGAAADAAKKTGLLSRAWGFLLKIIQKVKGAFSSVVGFFSKTSATTGQTASKVSRLGKVFKPVMSILGKFVKFAGPVGIAVWIGSIIAKSDSLKAKLGNVWDSLKEVGSALVGAFKEIGTALSPLAPAAKAVGKAIGPVFGFIDKIAGLAIGVVLDSLVYGFKSVANVIKGAGKIIAGFINVLVGLFTLDFGKMWDGLKQMASGVVPLLKGLFGVFITFFAPARLAKLGLGALKGLGGGIAKAMPGILSAVGRFLGSVLKFFGTLPLKLLSLGGKAISWLGKAIVQYAPKVLMAVGRLYLGIIKWILKLPGRLLSLGMRALKALGGAVVRGTPKVLAAAGRIFTGVVRWIAQLPGRLLQLGAQALSKLFSAVTKNTPKVLSAAGRIFTGIVEWIAKLPGRLLELGKSAITKLGSAISNGIGKLKGIAGNVFDAVLNGIKALPGKVLDIGKNIIGSLISGITGGLGKLGGAMGKVGDVIGKFLPGSPVREGPLTAWNHGSDASGGGRNIIEAITGGLGYTRPIRRAMEDIANTVSESFNPRVAAAVAGTAPAAVQVAPVNDPNAGGGNVYIGNLMPHDYNEFNRQMRAEKRLASLGGRVVTG